MSIYDGYTVNVNFQQNKCELNEDIHLYKNDKKIPLYFEFVEYIGNGFIPKMYKADLLAQFDVEYIKMLILKPNGEEYRSEELPITTGEIVDVLAEAEPNYKFQFIVEGTLLDEFDEIGDFDIQFRFYNHDECVISLPPIINQFHVHKPIVDDNSATGTSQVGTIIKDEAPLVAFSNGHYVKTNWANRTLITSGKMNKIEEGIYQNSILLKTINDTYRDYKGMKNKPSINGHKLEGRMSLDSLGISSVEHTHDYAPLVHEHNDYSKKGHTHSEYAVVDHEHGDYAKFYHNHTEYAKKTHKHDEYALIEHKHTEYAEKTHKHSYKTLEDLPSLVDGIELSENGEITLKTGEAKVGESILLPKVKEIAGLKFEEGKISLQNEDGLVGEEIELPKYADGLAVDEEGKVRLINENGNVGSSIRIPMSKFRKIAEGEFSETNSETTIYEGYENITELKIRLSNVTGVSNSAIYISINDERVGDIVYNGMSLSSSVYGVIEIEDFGYYLIKYAFGSKNGNATWITRNHFSDSYDLTSKSEINKLALKGTNLTVGYYEVWGR